MKIRGNKEIETIIKFMGVGVLNTCISALLMLLLYNICSMGYWGASIVAYVISSVFSFCVNKKFTFNNDGKVTVTAIKFALTVGVCYIVAYSIAKPLVSDLIFNLQYSIELIEQISMIVGMVLFTILNYIGQKFFVFK